MTSEIAESFMGTCHLMIEYYRALKKNVVHNGLNKSNRKLASFVQKLRKSAPLVRQTGKMSKKDKQIEELKKLLKDAPTTGEA